MLNRIQSFSNMPAPLKIGLLVAGGAGIGTVLYIIASMFSRQLCYIIFGGLALVACIMFLYWRIVKFSRKRKAAPLERGLKENTSATPQEISEATRMARLDDLRKKFETGIETFRSAGKNLYDFPWYLIVGEPGSGKTEAIRHCNIGFPPGLQDEFQGAGGTLNMNWWFTDHAVILDTAGRLMFEEVQAGQSSEWVEFLRLLKKSRSNCPINGVLLAIPADSLIKDTADEIERKASKIARQFDLIQRTLDVRFPVFVVITKSDLITGFRDFFDKLEDPQLQHQILGWSNPSPLDEPYNPGFIEQHLTTICGRLFRRRLALMRHVADGDEMDAGLGQIDSLYAFPQGLSKLAPRMARYLELIFSVGNQWSGKPLFFRGIYFTSSMQEGSALDEDLAEALGVPVDSLPDGRAWMRDRAYFLRDLFMKKIFQEKGLVTRATNARKQHTRRKAVVLCSGILSVLILIAFTIYTAWGFNSNIDRLGRFFSQYTGERPEDVIDMLKVVKAESGKYSYKGYLEVSHLDVNAQMTETEDDNCIFRSGYHIELDSAIKTWEEKKGRWWLSRIAPGRINSNKLRQAQKILYEQTVLIPFVDAAREKLLSEKGDKISEADKNSEAKIIEALMALKLENAYSSHSFLDSYEAYISGDEMENAPRGWPYYKEEREYLHQLLINKEGNDNDSAVEPPYISLEDAHTWVKDKDDFSPRFKVLWNDWGKIDIAINTGCKRLIIWWSDLNNIIRGDDELNNMKKIASYFGGYDKAEQALLNLSSPDSTEWAAKFNELKKHKSEIDNWFGNNSEVAKMPSLEDKVESVYSALTDSANEQFEPLQKMLELEAGDKTTNAGGLLKKAVVKVDGKIPGLPGKKPEIKPTDQGDYRSTLESAPDEIRDAIKTDKDQQIREYALLDELFWKKITPDSKRVYQERFEMYDEVNQLFGQEGLIVIKSAADVLEKMKTQTEKLPPKQESEDKHDHETGRGRFTKAMELCKNLVIRHALDSAPRNISILYGSIQPESTADEIGEQKYDPDIAKQRNDAWKRLKADVSADFAEEYKKGGEIYQRYIDEYKKYWLEEHAASRIKGMIGSHDTWDARRRWLGELQVGTVGGRLDQLYGEVNAAIDVFWATESADTGSSDTFFGPVNNAVEFWLELGGSAVAGDGNSDPLVVRRALLRMRAAVWIGRYYKKDKSERDLLAVMYISKLAEQTIRVLAADVKSTREQHIANVTSLAKKFPFSRTSGQDITITEIGVMQADLREISSHEPWPEFSIGYGSNTTLDLSLLQTQLLFAKQMLEDIGDWQRDIDTAFKDLRDALQTTSGLDEATKIEKIENLMACLPEKGQWLSCTVSLANPEMVEALSRMKYPINTMYRDFKIVMDDGQEKFGRTVFNKASDPTILQNLEYPWQGFNIEILVDATHLGGTQLKFSFPGKWSFMRMMLDEKYNYKQQGGKRFVRFMFNEAGTEALWLQLEFKRGETIITEWPSLSEWPD